MKYILLLFLCLVSCKENGKTYTVIDKFDEKHKYDRFPEKDSTTVYCQIHYEWETIKHFYTEEGIKYWMQNLKYFERISR